MPRLVILGGSGPLGREVIRLLAAGESYVALGRHPPPDPAIPWQPFDPAVDTLGSRLDEARILIHLAPLPLLPRLIEAELPAGLERIVALGTTSVLFKKESGSPRERRIAHEQLRAEAALAHLADLRGLTWTLLRPTLTYGPGDRNVSRIAGFIRRFRFFPIVGSGSGLRQPLLARDLARASLAVLDYPKTLGQSYDLGGGETLTYRAMVVRIFGALGLTPRIVPVPLAAMRSGLAVAARFPGWHFLDPEMAERMMRDLVVESARARADFGFDPGSFSPAECLGGGHEERSAR